MTVHCTFRLRGHHLIGGLLSDVTTVKLAVLLGQLPHAVEALLVGEDEAG